jgi:diguanylate cyclase (GGDEF)-like protein
MFRRNFSPRHLVGPNLDSRTPRPVASRLALTGMAAVLLGMSGFAVWASSATKQSLTVVSRVTALTHDSDAAALALEGEESLMREYLFRRGPEIKAGIISHSAGVTTYLGTFKRDGDAVDGVLADKLLRLHQTYVTQNATALAAADRGDTSGAIAIHEAAEPIFDDVQAQLAATSAHELAESRAAVISARDFQNFLVTVTAPAFGAGMLLLLALALVVLAYRRSADQRAAEVEHQALHDSLTGLPNRALFRDRGQLALATAARNRTSGAVMLLDLDRFKEVNDTLGHDQGDALLRDVATRLKATLRNSDTVARLGGDEFTILLPDVPDKRSAMAVAGKVATALQQPFLVGGVTLDIEVSIGVAVFPEHGDEIDTLVSRADVAMFVSKRDHSGSTAYAAELDANTPRALSLLGELRRALDNGDLFLDYQPKADIATGEVVGVEALVRWKHSTLGLVPPADFVPLAERTGLIYPLTQFVMNTALQECRGWLDSGLELPVAINISARNLLDDQFPELVASLLRKWRVPPRMLQLEITENSMMGDPVRVRASLLALTDLHVTLSIDDFGTGYSSLSYLKDLPVRELKIDRSFVMDLRAHPANRMIVNSVISLGQNLGLRVVAEGVEDQDAWGELAALGCDLAQGFFLARPMSGNDIPAWRLAWLAEHAKAPEPSSTKSADAFAPHTAPHNGDSVAARRP